MSDDKRGRAPKHQRLGPGDESEASHRTKAAGSKAHWRAPYSLLAPRQTKLRQELGKR
jgi:hypothetical protein